MRFDILTLFPEMVEAVLGESIIGRARDAGLIEVHTHQIRDYSHKKHHNVDDTPYGGGMGMLMAAPPICECFDAVLDEIGRDTPHLTLYPSPRGERFTQETARAFSREYDHIILLCGHYEGVDERAIEEIGAREVSIGDFVLTGGEIPACVIVDATARMIDGVLADPLCYEGESIASGLLEYPQYTRPPLYRDRAVPEILLSGNHEQIDRWRTERSLELTRARRRDLYDAYMQNSEKETRKK